jgi:hypothetical protein
MKLEPRSLLRCAQGMFLVCLWRLIRDSSKIKTSTLTFIYRKMPSPVVTLPGSCPLVHQWLLVDQISMPVSDLDSTLSIYILFNSLRILQRWMGASAVTKLKLKCDMQIHYYF